MRNTFLKSLPKETLFAVFFALVSLLTLTYFLFPTQTTKTVTQAVDGKKTQPTPTPSVVTTPTAFPTNKPEEDDDVTPTPQTVQITIVVTPTPSQNSQTTSDKATIHVAIDSGGSFDITLNKGSNQCDVLNQSLSDKKISNLVMKYDNSLDSYGVYVINSLGKDNAVWWTYEVNGKSPNMGCNHVAANHGDSVLWKYIGSR